MYAKNITDLTVGQEVTTPLGKRAIIKKLRKGDRLHKTLGLNDPFERVELEYLDERQVNAGQNYGIGRVTLQPYLLELD